MGFWSGVCSVASSVVSSACSCIGAAVSAIGGTVCGLAKAVATVIPHLNTASFVVRAIATVAEVLGIIPKNEDMGELGAKAMQDNVESRSNFSSTEAYIKYLTEEVQLDKDKLNKANVAEKLAYIATGTSIVVDGISEKTKVGISADFLAVIDKKKLDGNEVKSCIETFSSEGETNLNLAEKYLSGTDQKATDSVRAESLLINSLAKAYPNLSQEQLSDKLVELLKR